MKHITVVTACYNEAENVVPLYQAVKSIFTDLLGYTYSHLFIDNASVDETLMRLRELAAQDAGVQVIVNARNFGHVRSPFHALREAKGDAVIMLVADFQEPPALIRTFIEKWEAGFPIVVGVKTESDESAVMYRLRSFYYAWLNRISDTALIPNFTGFGLYDRRVLDALRSLHDPHPYLRGLISEIGFEKAIVPFRQPVRERGQTKNNFWTLYDMAMLGMTTHARFPLRIVTLIGFLGLLSSLLGLLCLFLSGAESLSFLGMGLFFGFSVQLVFTGLLSEYILAIHVQTLGRPLVIEKERINFDNARP